jgi:hypothetical protein
LALAQKSSKRLKKAQNGSKKLKKKSERIKKAQNGSKKLKKAQKV